MYLYVRIVTKSGLFQACMHRRCLMPQHIWNSFLLRLERRQLFCSPCFSLRPIRIIKTCSGQENSRREGGREGRERERRRIYELVGKRTAVGLLPVSSKYGLVSRSRFNEEFLVDHFVVGFDFQIDLSIVKLRAQQAVELACNGSVDRCEIMLFIRIYTSAPTAHACCSNTGVIWRTTRQDKTLAGHR
jgi:hypothetical protein